jgi:hypothetical protein
MEADVTDGSGKANNGTAEGNPIYVDGPAGYGKALQFDGVDDDVVLPIGTLISTMTSCSVATWVNFNTTSTGFLGAGLRLRHGHHGLHVPESSPEHQRNDAVSHDDGSNGSESGLNSPTNLSAG